MTGSSDRVAVATNGHHPPLATDVLATSSPPAPSSSSGEPALVADPAAEPRIRIDVSAGQVAVGLGVLISVVLLLVGRRRRDGD